MKKQIMFLWVLLISNSLFAKQVIYQDHNYQDYVTINNENCLNLAWELLDEEKFFPEGVNTEDARMEYLLKKVEQHGCSKQNAEKLKDSTGLQRGVKDWSEQMSGRLLLNPQGADKAFRDEILRLLSQISETLDAFLAQKAREEQTLERVF